MKRKNVILVVVVALIAGSAGQAYMMWNKPHRDIASEEATFELDASALLAEYQENAASADDNYLNQAIVVSGKVAEVKVNDVPNYLILGNSSEDGAVVCYMTSNQDISTFEVGQDVSVQGKVDGYDDLFGEVKLTECTINL